ncbi:MFS transporter [Streptomyces malaysiensis]|uniref:MFS transporter n=1 Tax=Streptomyces malaysiensis TaxID=92644 RepID=UPI002B28F9F8|nr:MFS transporter [Streptomyces malaysiensis]
MEARFLGSSQPSRSHRDHLPSRFLMTRMRGTLMTQSGNLDSTTPDTPLSAPRKAGSSPGEVRRVAVSAYLGNSIEFYDFLLYGSAAGVFFGPLFFPELDPITGVIASMATLGTGYLARPLGGLVLARVGDRHGRKRVLLATIVMMGLASGLIGLLPTYDQIGVAAPIMLVFLRLVQGFAAGGEWGGSSLMAAEHAPPGKRGLITAIGQAGLPTGGLLSALMLAVVSLLPSEQLMSWGWRIPFLLSFGLLGLALYVRTRISESPLFEEQKAATVQRVPLLHVLRRPVPLLRGVVATLPSSLPSTLFGSFAVAYAVGLGAERSHVLVALGFAWAGAVVTSPVYGWVSDRFGRRPLYLAATVGLAVCVYPLMLGIGSGSTPLMGFSFFAAFTFFSQAASAPLAAMLSEMYPTSSRFTGMTIAYQGASVVTGFFPVLASGLLAAAGGGRNIGWVALVVAAVAILAGASVWFGRESSGSDLRSV